MSDRPLVVLLHGLARTHRSMAGLARFVEASGFETWMRSYPSRSRSISDLARGVTEALVADAGGRPLFAITHSLGGILVRHMHDPRLSFRRIVMLAPPNAGSELAALMARSPALRWFYGPAIDELGAARRAEEVVWPSPPAPFMVIAGTRARAMENPTSWTVGRRLGTEGHDGTVLVSETRLEGMAAFATVDASHTWIMNDAAARSRALAFLRGEDQPSAVG